MYRYIQEVALVASPLYPGQNAYQEGKSMEAALAEVVREVEKGMTNWGLALAVMLDMDGAFNYTAVESICLGAPKNAVPDTVVSWMQRLLSSRVIETLWKHHMLRAWVSRGCPQEGAISPPPLCGA